MDITLLWFAFVAFVIMTILKYTTGIRATTKIKNKGSTSLIAAKSLQLLILRPGAAISERAPTRS